jgi:hypothetical protein
MLLGANLHVRQRFGDRFLIFSEWHSYIKRETKRDRHRHRHGYSSFLPSSRYKNLNPKLKPNTAGIACFSKTLFINYCRSSKSLSKCKCWSSIYTNWTIPKLPFQILTTASALLQLSIIYMSTSLKPFSLSSFFYAFLQTHYLLLWSCSIV